MRSRFSGKWNFSNFFYYYFNTKLLVLINSLSLSVSLFFLWLDYWILIKFCKCGYYPVNMSLYGLLLAKVVKTLGLYSIIPCVCPIIPFHSSYSLSYFGSYIPISFFFYLPLSFSDNKDLDPLVSLWSYLLRVIVIRHLYCLNS